MGSASSKYILITNWADVNETSERFSNQSGPFHIAVNIAKKYIFLNTLLELSKTASVRGLLFGV
jgi:hypothetical protein